MIGFAQDCNCVRGSGVTVYLKDEDRAIALVQEHQERATKDPRNLYWGVHLNGRHILYVD